MTNPHPLMRVLFRFHDEVADDFTVERYFYHVPSAGDYVELVESDVTIVGRIDQVTWHENYVEVRL